MRLMVLLDGRLDSRTVFLFPSSDDLLPLTEPSVTIFPQSPGPSLMDTKVTR